MGTPESVSFQRMIHRIHKGTGLTQDFTVYAPHRRVLWRFDDTVEHRAGFTPPAERDVRKILALGEELLAEKADQLLIHCHAGVSRSTATAVILMAQNNPGREADVFGELARWDSRPWPSLPRWRPSPSSTCA